MTSGSLSHFGTTAGSLSHYFGNCVGMARLRHFEVPKPSSDVFGGIKKAFIAGLEGIINRGEPEFGGITQENLREMIQLAQNKSWNSVEAIKDLYSFYGALTQKNYNLQELFPET